MMPWDLVTTLHVTHTAIQTQSKLTLTIEKNVTLAFIISLLNFFNHLNITNINITLGDQIKYL